MFGMPGYPTSCLSNAYMLLVPFLRAIARLPALACRARVQVPLARRVVSHHRATPVLHGAARRTAAPNSAFKASGDITSMSQADGYIEIPAQTDVVEAGTVVTVTLF